MVYFRKWQPAAGDIKGDFSGESRTAYRQSEHLRVGHTEYVDLAVHRGLRGPGSHHRLHDENGGPAEDRPADCHQARAVRGQAPSVEHVTGSAAERSSQVTLWQPLVKYMPGEPE